MCHPRRVPAGLTAPAPLRPRAPARAAQARLDAQARALPWLGSRRRVASETAPSPLAPQPFSLEGAQRSQAVRGMGDKEVLNQTPRVLHTKATRPRPNTGASDCALCVGVPITRPTSTLARISIWRRCPQSSGDLMDSGDTSGPQQPRGLRRPDGPQRPHVRRGCPSETMCPSDPCGVGPASTGGSAR